MDTVNNLLLGFSVSLQPMNLLYSFVGVLLGTVVGVLPGLGSAATIALLLPVTYAMPPTSAIIMLAGIWYGSMYGGSTTSILLRVPGEAASVMTCIDGFEMAKRGRAGVALGISAFGSFIAGTFGLVGLIYLAPPLAEFALLLQAGEFARFAFLLFPLAPFLRFDGSDLRGGVFECRLLLFALTLERGQVLICHHASWVNSQNQSLASRTSRRYLFAKVGRSRQIN